MFHAENAYFMPAAKIATKRMKTNTVSNTAFRGVPVPSVAMSVSDVDGVTGGNVFLITLDGAKMLAASRLDRSADGRAS